MKKRSFYNVIPVFIFLLLLGSPGISFAEIQMNPSSMRLPSSVDEIVSTLPAPFREFINSIERQFPMMHMPGGGPMGISQGLSGLQFPQQFSAGGVIGIVKAVVIFVGQFAVVILRIMANLIETVFRWVF